MATITKEQDPAEGMRKFLGISLLCCLNADQNARMILEKVLLPHYSS